MRIWPLSACIAVAICSAACGGSGEPDLFNAGNVSGAGGQAGAGGSAGAGGTTNPGDGAAQSDVAAGGSAQPDGGLVDTPNTITCGQQSCSLADNKVCCVGAAAPTGYECADRGACPAATPNPVELRCASDANCGPGAVCCLSHSSGTSFVSQCQTACYAGDAHLCNSKAARTGCETFQTCSATGISGWGLPAASYAMCN
jgi:hypothetical protein